MCILITYIFSNIVRIWRHCMHSNRTYIAIDLKSYYASAECVARGLDPLTTNLVVADITRTEKTICLAVSPSLKAYGIPGRGRLFEVVQKVKELNCARQYPFLLFASLIAFPCVIPSFRRFRYLVRTRFHFFQNTIRMRLRIHSSVPCSSFFISASL